MNSFNDLHGLFVTGLFKDMMVGRRIIPGLVSGS